jgi:hypothetical protein
MTDRASGGDGARASTAADIEAFFRRRADVPRAGPSALISALGRLRGSDDPVVAFGGLPAACVPDFADGCLVELSAGAEPLFRVAAPAGRAESPAAGSVGSDRVLVTPFRAASGTAGPSYAGVVTHWWTGRAPAEGDAVIAELMVGHVVALVEQERLLAALGREEDRAAGLAVAAISGRTISLATGIVMHQDGLAADEAEAMLRRSAAMTGQTVHQVAAGVVRSGSLRGGPAAPGRPRRAVSAPAGI